MFSDRCHCERVAVMPTRTLAVARSAVRTLLTAGSGLSEAWVLHLAQELQATRLRAEILIASNHRRAPGTPGSPGTGVVFLRAAPGRAATGSAAMARSEAPASRKPPAAATPTALPPPRQLSTLPNSEPPGSVEFLNSVAQAGSGEEPDGASFVTLFERTDKPHRWLPKFGPPWFAPGTSVDNPNTPR